MIKKVLIDKANRTYQFPPDLFSFLPDNEKPSLIKKTELIDLGKFNWNIPYSQNEKITPESLAPASTKKLDELRETISDWIYELHKIRINPKKEIYIGGSVSQILFATALAYIEPSDVIFVPKLGLPTYRKVITACGGEAVSYDISLKSNWSPDFTKLSTRLGHVARMLFLNTPHNPTGYTLKQTELEQLIALASKENIAVINDTAYQSIVDKPESSLIGTKGGKRIGIELYSFSYQFGLPKLPFGFAVGSKDLIEGLTRTSSLFAQHIPQYYVDMALEGIRKFPSDNIAEIKKQFIKSKNEAEKLFELFNIESLSTSTYPFIWGKLAKRKSSQKFATQLFRKYRILSIPGTVFGNNGEGFIRLSLTASASSYQEAYKRVKKRLLLTDKNEQIND